MTRISRFFIVLAIIGVTSKSLYGMTQALSLRELCIRAVPRFFSQPSLSASQFDILQTKLYSSPALLPEFKELLTKELLRLFNCQAVRVTTKIIHSPTHIAALALQPKQVAIGFTDGTVFLQDIALKKQVQLCQHDSAIKALAFSPDGLCIAAVSDHKLWLGKADTYECIKETPITTQSLQIVTLTNNCTMLVGGGTCKPLNIWLNKAARHTVISNEQCHLGGACSLLITVSEQVIIVGTGSGALCVWDVGQALESPSNYQPHIYAAHQSAVRVLTLMPTGKRFLSGSDDGKMRLWEYPAGTYITLKRDVTPLQALAVIPDGQTIIALVPSTIQVVTLKLLQHNQSLPSDQVQQISLVPVLPAEGSLKAIAITSENTIIGLSAEGALTFYEHPHPTELYALFYIAVKNMHKAERQKLMEHALFKQLNEMEQGKIKKLAKNK